jgi:diguanylate cyclase (GGDEF)-like protein
MAPLAAAVVVYPFLPSGQLRDVAYQSIALVAVLAACWGLLRQGSARPSGWLLVLGGYLGWLAGDPVHALGVHVLGTDDYPGPAAVVRLASYGLVVAGLLVMTRRRGERRDLTAVLDVAVLAVGVAVVAGVFLIAPTARDSSLSLDAQLMSSAYPLAGVLVLSILVRLWMRPGAKTAAFRLLSASLALTLLGNALYDYALVDSETSSSVLTDVLWLAGFVLVAGASWAWAVPEPTKLVPGQVVLVDPRSRLGVLAVGLVLPGLAFLVDGLTEDDTVSWPVVAVGTLLMSLLVVTQMRGMLTVMQNQTLQLAGLARSDALTGIPNQRTWEFELARAAKSARGLNAPLTVAFIDLDAVQEYYEAHGHPAGDQLIREAASAWWDLLQPGQVLARAEGGRFALLCPSLWADDVRPMIEAMRSATPGGQTTSVGIATWNPQSEPSSVVAAAEQALEEAKRGGRNQIQLAPRPTSTTLIPRPTMFWQPIVDLRTTLPVGVEALSRFPENDPLTVFEAAAKVGSGPTLEAVAITYALSNRPHGLWVAVNVSLEALASVQVQRALAGNLTGVVLEITEHADSEMPDLARVLQGYRARGASIAVDDWGPGFSNIDRLVILQPDIVKLDITRVSSLSSDYQGATIGLITEWAEMVGAKICAEGVETEEQWQQLCGFGVHLGQGHFFGRPMPPEELLTMPRDSVAARVGDVPGKLGARARTSPTANIGTPG